MGMDVNRYTRVCACALVTLTHLNIIFFRLCTFLSLPQVVLRVTCKTALWQGGDNPDHSSRTQEWVSHRSERGKYRGHVLLLMKSLREHIAAAMLSDTHMCVWYIVERAQTHHCCAGPTDCWVVFSRSHVSGPGMAG